MRSDRTMIRTLRALGLGSALFLATLLVPALVAAADPITTPCTTPAAGEVSCELWAKPGTLLLPGGATVDVWGYAAAAGDDATLPGPALVANAGDTITLTLHNALTEPTALLVAGLPMAPDLTGIDPGADKTYTISVPAPGTYLYEAGLLDGADHQVAMGLYGALIVRPAAAGQAYDSAASAFDDEALVVLSEIDPALNANPAAFDMRNFAPRYQLVNGTAYPDTAPIATTAGNRVLLRYVNAGVQHHSMAILGASQEVIAGDGSPLAYPRTLVAETLAPGATTDVLVTMPSTTGMYPIYDANLFLSNNGAAGFGGMVVFLDAGAAPPPSAGPTADIGSVAPNPATGAAGPAPGGDVTVKVVISGGTVIQAAELRIDSIVAAPIAMTADDSAFDSPSEFVTGTIPQATVAGLSTGAHTIYVRGSDASGWGSFDLAPLTVDHDGPTTGSLALTASPTNGSVAVTLSGTASDAASGGSAVDAAEYFVDGVGADGSGTAMTLGTGTAIRSVTATLGTSFLEALSEGPHALSVHARDALGSWGPAASITIVIDRTGPTASAISATPNPTNGQMGVNSSTPAVRVVATFTDAAATVAGGELFIDSVGGNGQGVPFMPSDGLFNSGTETGYADIPLTTVAALAQGPHTLSIHGKDSAGNWAATTTYTLVVDKLAPTVSSVLASPNPTNTTSAPYTNNTSFTLTANADGTGSNVVAAEWYEGTDPGIGNGTAIVGFVPAPTVSLSTSIDFVARGWLPGNHVVSIRAKDAAGNWSTSGSVTVVVVLPNLIFASTFDNAISPYGWSSVGGTAANLSVVGSHLQATISGGASGYVQDNTPAAEARYLVRFALNPNNLAFGNNGAASSARTIFTALSPSGQTVFQVQLHRTSTTGTFEVRAVVSRAGGGGGTSTTNWFAISNNTDTLIEVSWVSANNASFSLSTGGVVRQTFTGLNTSAYLVETVRLGPQGSLSNVSGSILLDSFVSARRSLVGL